MPFAVTCSTVNSIAIAYPSQIWYMYQPESHHDCPCRTSHAITFSFLALVSTCALTWPKLWIRFSQPWTAHCRRVIHSSAFQRQEPKAWAQLVTGLLEPRASGIWSIRAWLRVTLRHSNVMLVDRGVNVKGQRREKPGIRIIHSRQKGRRSPAYGLLASCLNAIIKRPSYSKVSNYSRHSTYGVDFAANAYMRKRKSASWRQSATISIPSGDLVSLTTRCPSSSP